MNTLYEKRGRRYVPVAESVAIDSLPSGAHLVVVEPGIRSVTRRIDPAEAAIRAACRSIEKDVSRALLNGLEMRTTSRSLTPKQANAWQALKDAMGDDRFIVEYPSAQEIVNEVCAVIRKKAMEGEQ